MRQPRAEAGESVGWAGWRPLAARRSAGGCGFASPPGTAFLGSFFPGKGAVQDHPGDGTLLWALPALSQAPARGFQSSAASPNTLSCIFPPAAGFIPF